MRVKVKARKKSGPWWKTDRRMHGACGEARSWIARRRFKNIQAAWDACEKFEWMMWLLDTIIYQSKYNSLRKTLAYLAMDESCRCYVLRLVFPKPPGRA